MTEDAVPQQTPHMTYNGQVYSREHAAAELAKLDGDKDFVAAALGGDVSKQQLRRDFWMMARGYTPGATPAMPSDANGIHEQVAAREEQITEARLDTFAKHVRMNPEMRAQFKRRLATADQHDLATNERARLLKDGSFRQRVLNGDADAVDHWVKICQTASAPVAPKDYDWSKDQI
jgi:hypothetical protein